MNTNDTKLDLYIKDEGYADVRLITDEAKNWAHKLGFENSLIGITPDDTYYGEKVWNHITKTGPYHFSIATHTIHEFMDVIDASGLNYESEF